MTKPDKLYGAGPSKKSLIETLIQLREQRKSRSIEEHLHEHLRAGASSVAEYTALHRCPALLHCLWLSQTGRVTGNCDLPGCVVVAAGRIAQSRARIPGVHQRNWDCHPAAPGSRNLVFFARPSGTSGPAP